MRKITATFLFLFFATTVILTSCSLQASIYGVWQDINDKGTIEFKKNGEVIIIDNMSATVTGTYELKDNQLITFELTATDVMKDSIQPIDKTIVTANIIKLSKNELQINFAGRTGVEHYKRIR